MNKVLFSCLQPQGDLQNPSQLADFAAANTSSEAESIQAVLEELDVPKRLEMALLMLKKELELSKLQVSALITWLRYLVKEPV